MSETNKAFEALYIQNAPSWSIERDSDGGYKYHATKSAFVLFESQQGIIADLQNQLTLCREENKGLVGSLNIQKGEIAELEKSEFVLARVKSIISKNPNLLESIVLKHLKEALRGEHG